MAGYAILGLGGFARELVPLAQQAAAGSGLARPVVFATDLAGEVGRTVNGIMVVGLDELGGPDHRGRGVVLSLADHQTRRRLADDCARRGLALAGLTAATAEVDATARVGPGAVLCHFTCIHANATIGRHFHCNIYSYVAHDCTVGDFVTFAPRVSCNGNVVVEDGVYVGCGAVIRDGKPGRPLRVGRGAVVGMGAVVTRDVPAGAVVVGNPAQPRPEAAR